MSEVWCTLVSASRVVASFSSATAGPPVLEMSQPWISPRAPSVPQTPLPCASEMVHSRNTTSAPDRRTTADVPTRSMTHRSTVPPALSVATTPAPVLLFTLQSFITSRAPSRTNTAAGDSARISHSSRRSRPTPTSTAARRSSRWVSTRPDSVAASVAISTLQSPVVATRTLPRPSRAVTVTGTDR